MAQKITVEHLRRVLVYVDRHSAITNRECRVATGVGYDSAIKIFGALCAAGMLKKIGETSGTKYVAWQAEKPSTERAASEQLSIAMSYLMKNSSTKNE